MSNCNNEIMSTIMGKINEINVGNGDIRDSEGKSLNNDSGLGYKLMLGILESTLNDYNISLKQTSLTLTTDLPEKIKYYIACKKLEGLSIRTLKNYKYFLVDFASFIYKPVSDINTYDLRCYIDTKKKEVIASTLNSMVWKLKTFFVWLEDEEYITKNPAKNLKPIKEPNNLRRSLTIEELELIRDNCVTHRERAVVEFLLATGVRVGEVVGLKISDISNGAIKVLGKGDKERIIYVNKKAMYYIKKYLKTRKGNSEYLFIGERSPYRFIGARCIEDVLNNIGNRIELNIFPHAFRYTFSCFYLERGGNLGELQILLGHEDINTTCIYAKYSDLALRSAYAKYSAS